jgi:hypothetical protein
MDEPFVAAVEMIAKSRAVKASFRQLSCVELHRCLLPSCYGQRRRDRWELSFHTVCKNYAAAKIPDGIWNNPNS